MFSSSDVNSSAFDFRGALLWFLFWSFPVSETSHPRDCAALGGGRGGRGWEGVWAKVVRGRQGGVWGQFEGFPTKSLSSTCTFYLGGRIAAGKSHLRTRPLGSLVSLHFSTGVLRSSLFAVCRMPCPVSHKSSVAQGFPFRSYSAGPQVAGPQLTCNQAPTGRGFSVPNPSPNWLALCALCRRGHPFVLL